MNEVLKELISHIELPVDQLADQDSEIVEIFIEEVQEILEFLEDAIPTWIEKPSDADILKDIRRSFHTLKGSGRMAGAVQSGELAWSIEEMLNRHMAGSVPLSKDLQDLVHSVATLYPILVTDFQKLEKHQLEFRPWIAAAQMIRDGQELPPALRYTVNYYQDKIIPSEDVDVVVSAPVVESVVVPEEVEFTLDAQEEVALSSSPVSEAAELEEKVELVNQMMEIFLEESNEHLQTISQFLKLQVDPSLEQYNQLIRAIHTIRGSSGMVEIDAIFAASSSVENVFKYLSQEEGQQHIAEQQLLLDYYEYVKSYATVLADDGNANKLAELDQQFNDVLETYKATNGSKVEEENTQGLVAKLLDLEINELLDAEFSFVEQVEQNAHVYLNQLLKEVDILQQRTTLRQTETLHKVTGYLARCYRALLTQDTLTHHLHILDEIQALHQYLIDAFDGLASGQNFVISNLMTEEFEAVIESIVGLTPEIVSEASQDLADPTITISETPAESASNVAPIVEVQNANTDFDADLLSIFLEESEELVAGMDNDFAIWEKDPKNTQVLKNLFRYLHTLKGGANMVQATHLGDIAHELESIYERVLKGLIQPNNITMQVIRYAQDEIATRLQKLSDQSIDVANPQLIQSLKDILSGDIAQSADVVSTPVSEPVIDIPVLDVAPVEEAHTGERVAVEDVQIANAEFDEDLLSIFLEESEELVVGMDNDFNIWEKDPKNTQVLNNLFRYLHTLKGGANMVQATHLGDIAHELESIYERVLKGSIQPTSSAMQTIRYAQDEIATRLQRLEKHKIDEDNPVLIAQLRAIVVGGYVANTSVNAPVVDQSIIVTQPVDEAPYSVEMPVTAPSAPVVESVEIAEEKSDVPVVERDAEIIPPVLARALQSGDESRIIIAQTYYEEAEELLQEGKSLFSQWVIDRGNRSVLLGLQRIFHTLKGNSRVVEEQLIAVMAYQLESVFEQFAFHEFTSDRYDSLLRHTQNWLNEAIFKGRFEGAESVKSRLQAITYEESLVPEGVQGVISETIDFGGDVNELIEGDGSEPPAMYQVVEQTQDAVAQEQIRISADLVEKLIDLSGESAINRSRIELDLGQMTYTLTEMELAIHRLADQLRRMEGELEAQILAKHEGEGQRYVDFDPLEMDQYSSLNQLSKSLAESASDLIDFKSTLADKIRDTENLLLQQSRIQNELQQSLMGTRLVPFSRLVPRLQRLVRQTSTTLNRPVELNIENTEGELDRNILERLVNPLEHMLRNAIDHGVEDVEGRQAAGKSATGHINLNIAREGNDILVIFSDDGRGINVEAVKNKAQNNGLITEDMQLSDVDIMQYIFHPGLSTAQKVTQISGRGVGLDVVQNEIKALGGHVSVTSTLGKGTEFIIRVPTTVAVSNALMVKVGDQQFAIPLAQIERIVRVSPVALMEYYDSQDETFELDQIDYRLRYVGEFVTGHTKPTLSNMGASVPVIIYNSGGRTVALQVDQLVGSRAQIVIKAIGQQLSSVGFVGGATILADGRVCLILDGQSVSRRALTTPRTKQDIEVISSVTDLRAARRTIMVVDDSVTVRKVTTRLLERQGFDVVTAKDGVDALEKLAQFTPDLMLLDIEMPRMDGFEVAQYVRHDSNQRDLPIIMITSRTGEKHRERALSLGVNQYMGKPFQESELLSNIKSLLEAENVN